MDESTTNNTQPTPEQVRLAGRPLSFYWNTAKVAALVAAAVDAILIIAHQPNIYLWGVHLVLFAGLTVLLRISGQLTFGSAVTLSTIGGLATGFLVAMFRLVWERKLFLLFNLITEPLLTAAGGFILAALVFTVLRPRTPAPIETSARRPRNRKEVNNHA